MFLCTGPRVSPYYSKMLMTCAIFCSHARHYGLEGALIYCEPSRCGVSDALLDGISLIITYIGPPVSFIFYLLSYLYRAALFSMINASNIQSQESCDIYVWHMTSELLIPVVSALISRDPPCTVCFSIRASCA